jgi:hypothetical protein
LRNWDEISKEPTPFREWCVVMSLANMERKLVLSAELAGLSPYLPRYQDLRGRERLLFRGYVFVNCPAEREPILWDLKGGHEPVSFNGVAARCSDATIKQLRARESKSGYITFAERFDYNEPVLVLEGPYKDSIVLYRGMDRDQRELALFSLLGRDVVKPFDRHELAALDIV